MRLLLGLTLLLLIGAETPGTEERPAPAAMTHTVEIRDFAFSPAELAVLEGDTVVWINHDAAPHTATDSLGNWDSGEIAAGERWTWIAMEAGRFPYLCAYHPSMTGSITVRAVEAGPQGSARGPRDAWSTP